MASTGQFRLGGQQRIGDHYFVELVDATGDTSLHCFESRVWMRAVARSYPVVWSVPAHEHVGPLPAAMAARVDELADTATQ